MTPLLILLVAAVGPMLAVVDSLSSNDEGDHSNDDDNNDQDMLHEQAYLNDYLDFIREPIAGDSSYFGDRGVDVEEQPEQHSELRGIYETPSVYGEAGQNTDEGGFTQDAAGKSLFSAFNRALEAESITEVSSAAEPAEETDEAVLSDETSEDTSEAQFDSEESDEEAAENDTLAYETYSLEQSAAGAVTVLDFDPEEDALLIEYPLPEALDIVDQTVSDEGLVITLNSGATITLPGVSEALPEDGIAFIEGSGVDDQAET